MALQFTSRQLKDNAVITAKINAGAVTEAKLGANAVTAAKADLTDTWDFSSGTLSAATPASTSNVATKGYVDSVSQGLYWKDAVKAATPANITLSGTQTIDGVSIAAGDRVLVRSQSTGSQNGIYVAAAGAWSRATDMDAASEFPGSAVFVIEGTTLGDTGWVCTNDAVTVGSTAVTFAQFAGGGTFIGGDGVAITGNSIAVDLATNSGLSFTGAKLQVGLKANGGINKDANGIFVNTTNGVQVDGSGNITLKLDGTSLAQGANGVKVNDLGVGTAQLADNAVTLAKSGFRPAFVDATGNGSTAAYDLLHDIDTDFYNAVMVYVNGQAAKLVASSPSDSSEYAVDRNGGSSKTRITFGGNLDTGDALQVRYLH